MNKERKKNENNQEHIHMLITTILVIIACVFVGIGIINSKKIVTFKTDDSRNTQTEQKKLAKSFSDIEGVQVAIKFNKITTDNDTYDKLRVACNRYMEKDIADNKVKVDTNVKVEENTFIDNKDNIEYTEQQLDNLAMHETGPIYFQNKLLLRYINSNGEMQLVASSINKDDSIHTCGKQDIKEIFNEKENGDEDTDNEQDNSEEAMTTISNNTITEKEYVDEITKLFIEALQIDNTDLDSNFKKQALKYFTYDGFDNILNSRDGLKLSDKASIKVNVAEAGKSCEEIADKDRIFIQLGISDNNNNVLVNIIVKLNKNFRVFDIDII